MAAGALGDGREGGLHALAQVLLFHKRRLLASAASAATVGAGAVGGWMELGGAVVGKTTRRKLKGKGRAPLGCRWHSTSSTSLPPSTPGTPAPAPANGLDPDSPPEAAVPPSDSLPIPSLDPRLEPEPDPDIHAAAPATPPDTRILTFRSLLVIPSSFPEAWSCYTSTISPHTDLLRALERPDFEALFGGIARFDRTVGAADRIEHVASDMRAVGMLASRDTFAKAVPFADILTLPEALAYLALVESFSPELVSDELYASLIGLIGRQMNVRGVQLLFDRAKGGGGAGSMTNDGGDQRAVAVAGLETYTAVVRAFCRMRNVEAALTTCREMAVSARLKPDVRIYNALLTAFTMTQRKDLVTQLMSRMQEDGVHPDSATYDAIIQGLGTVGDVEGALAVLTAMQAVPGVAPTPATLTIILDMQLKAGRVSEARQTLGIIQSVGPRPPSRMYDILIAGLAANGDISSAVSLFDSLPPARRINRRTYNIIIDSYFKAGDAPAASAFYHRMLDAGVRPNVATYTILFDGLSKHGDPETAQAIHAAMKAAGVPPDIVFYTTLIRARAEADDEFGVAHAWSEMLADGICPDTQFFNVLVWSSARTPGGMDAALGHVARLREAGLTPDVFTFSALVLGWIRSGRLDLAVRTVDEMESDGVRPNAITYQTLVDGLLAAGDPDAAMRYFELAASASAVDAAREAGGTGIGEDVANVPPRAEDYVALIDASSASLDALDAAELLYGEMAAMGLPLHSAKRALARAYQLAGVERAVVDPTVAAAKWKEARAREEDANPDPDPHGGGRGEG
ncbi:hypothetical protein BDK51DRAFT_27776 [Blyttiomyces helicus]|uniref:Pentacotripeptide-repeat region of PRORP domain-containing protein n=1 Tax=Blyttiomyces helicus TaxID=388810 RepID=A0A4P9WLI8_9FUNG|nr:hypothetical protein BDK51DRAFT_27776 [Blyttiomyces helicus]|eukprot:RKO92488.1 hypothetical protein BDK51DRAFT_27776 [Blyttiomyces helicus]